jgi:hypothetical protein
MYGSKAYSFLVMAILCTLLMCGCSGKTPPNGAAALNIATPSPLPTGAEGDAYREGMAAYGGVEPYTWTIDSGALPPGVTLTTGGVLSGTPPTGSAGQYNFTVRVTDSQTPVKAYQTAYLTLTINPALSFPSTSLSNAVIAVAYSGAVAAMGGVTCSTTPPPPPYNYALITDNQCLFTNLAACTAKNGGLTLNADGTITGTPTGPIGTYPFTVQATDCYPTTATANFNITVTGKIQGNYAFSFNGYNQQGQAFYMAGSFVADGNGNITSGVFDRNGTDAIGPMEKVAITPGSGATGQCPASGPPTGSGSVYCVGRTGVTNGGNLGTIVIASALGTYSFSVSLSLMSDSQIILAGSTEWGSGVLKSQGQSLAGISLASGDFVFGSFGVDSKAGRYAGAGYFATDANGIIQSGNGGADTNDNGTAQSQAALTGNVSSVDPATGRGTASLTIGSNTLDYAFYVVPPVPGKLALNSLLAVQTDAVSPGVPVTLASIVQRGLASGGTTIFSNKFLNATQGSNPNGVLLELNAVSNSAPDISLGLGNFDGAGNITGYTFDENKGGALTTPSQNSYTGTYSVATTGRVTVNLTGVTYNPVWYLISNNTGFVVGTDPGVTSGTFEPQTVTQPITIVSLFGNFYGGTSDPVLSSVINEVEVAVPTPPPPPGTGNGTFAATYDSSGTTGVMMNQMFAGTFCIADSTPCPSTQQAQSTTGRMLILDSNSNVVSVLYLGSAGAAGTTGNTKVVTLSTDANPRLTILTH